MSANPAAANEPLSLSKAIGAAVDSTGEATSSLTPELVIALCGPIGSPLHEAADQISNALAEYGYATEKIRLSNLIRLNATKTAIDSSSKFAEIKSLIEAGDALRKQFGNDVLAKLAIAKIGGDRRKKHGDFEDEANELAKSASSRISAHRICHVIDSIKNDSELRLLRLIYGDALFAVGVFSPLEVRKRNLERPGSLRPEEVNLLIDTDSGEEFDHGQSVRDTFPKCDMFLRVDHSTVGPSEPKAVAQLVEKLRRFFGLLLRTAVITPTREETAMYAAASASRNSACISRQVGASVTSNSGEVLAIGWNDVPRNGGGLYGKPSIRPAVTFAASSEDEPDERCFALTGARCHNDVEKESIAGKIADSLVHANLLAPQNAAAAIQAILADSRVKDLIEFSRAVHAEMHAILGAARVAGDRIVGGRLYVTTYPCHSCARHIVAAGISEVYYIEPYRKSLATRLHQDSLTESVEGKGKVRLLQFDGIAPRRFIDLFDAGSRKADGVLRLSARLEAVPSTHVSLKAIPRLEQVVVAEIATKHLNFPGLVAEEKPSGKEP
jgi:deoxycytidylate deaminase